jgi:hypothetical protein
MTSSCKSALTGCRYFVFAIISLIYGPVAGQLSLTFEKNQPLTGTWTGDISHFRVNAEGMLQLQAPGAGYAQIFTRYRIPSDSLSIELFLRMDFAPSSENMARIWLIGRDMSEEKATGYYLKLGENGSQDAIQWWKADKGMHRLLASGKMGGISGEPATARINATWHASGLCIMATDYDGQTFFEEDATFSDHDFMEADSVWFGIQCKYSASRKDKFFFDDIHILPLTKDETAPVVVSVLTNGDHIIEVEFSEKPEHTSANSASSYNVLPDPGTPDEVIFPCNAPNRACLLYPKEFESGVNHILEVRGVKDAAGNFQDQQIPFIHATKPIPGDLVITEILTNPFSGGEDFLELYNRSEKLLLLDSIMLENAEKQEQRIIRTGKRLKPGQYIALSADSISLNNIYEPPDTAMFLKATIPAMNIESVVLRMYGWKHGNKHILDSVRYHEEMHSDLLISSKGVSLEKILPSALAWDEENWHSASSVTGYGTPGYKNSVSISETPAENCDFCIFTDKKIFSPDGDGSDDYLALHYKMKKPGCKASLYLFDGEGYPAGAVNASMLLGSEGIVLWDGASGDGRTLPAGIYVLIFRWFHPDGDVGVSKHPVVIAKRN